LQTFDRDDVGISFSGLFFWHLHRYALGQPTNGLITDLKSRSFVVPAEELYALTNGERGGFVFSAFQVLLVRPVEGLWISVSQF
jgi:hypothetical protein